ncbi:hypothetical protein H9P43_007543 [Blastocladiella emersonii ATCC 22665]|nr:hypothetical protein H9P43_007543 [Blastocladiella emersonii ATCC 22665]
MSMTRSCYRSRSKSPKPPTTATAAYMCSLLDNMSPPPNPAAHAKAYLNLGTAQLAAAAALDAETSLRRAYDLMSPVVAPRMQTDLAAQWRAILTGLVAATEALGKKRQAEIFTEKLARFEAEQQ